MGKLVQLTEEAFRPGGPVAKLAGGHRPLQADIARDIALSIERGRGEHHRAGLSATNGEAGIGKTIALLIPMGLAIRLQNHSVRGLVATFTRYLRRQITVEMETVVNPVIAELTGGQISYAERKARSSFASQRRARQITAMVGNGERRAERLHFREYLNWLEREEVETGGLAEFSGWYEQPQSECRLPFGLSEIDLSLTEDEARNNEAYRHIVEEGRDADLAVITQTMLLQYVATAGAILDDRTGKRPFKMLAVDEADNLPDMARNASEAMVSLFALKNVVDALAGPTAARTSRLLEGLLTFCDHLYEGASQNGGHDAAVLLDPYPIYEPMVEQHLRPLVTMFDAIIESLPDDDEYLGAALELRKAMAVFDDVIRLPDQAGTSNSRYAEIKDTRPIVSWMPSRAFPRIGRVLPSAGAQINRLWRLYNTMPFDSVHFLSATLLGRQDDPTRPTFEMIRNRLGIWSDDNYNSGFSRCYQPDSFGSIGSVVYADRDAPRPSLDEPRIDNEGRVDWTNPAYVEHVATMQCFFYLPAPCRTLVLSHSGAFSNGLAECLVTQVPRENLLVQRVGQKIGSLREAYLENPHAILICFDWPGVDLRRAGQNSVDMLVLGKIPLPPLSEARALAWASDFGSRGIGGGRKFMLSQAVDYAYRRAIQGIGRAFRDETDHLRHLLLPDPRWPLPPEFLDQHKEMFASDDSLFSDFNRVFPSRFTRGIFTNVLTRAQLFTIGGEVIGGD